MTKEIDVQYCQSLRLRPVRKSRERHESGQIFQSLLLTEGMGVTRETPVSFTFGDDII